MTNPDGDIIRDFTRRLGRYVGQREALRIELEFRARWGGQRIYIKRLDADGEGYIIKADCDSTRRRPKG